VASNVKSKPLPDLNLERAGALAEPTLCLASARGRCYDAAPMNIIYLAVGGSLGTISRYYAGIWVTNATGARTPGTLLVNVLGSFLIGLFLTLSFERSWSNALVILVAVGFLGGFTTFSTFTWQTYQLLQSGEIAEAALNISASVAAGMLAVWAGATLAKAL
jgi:CrcB protein